jgi:hypothetical protein
MRTPSTTIRLTLLGAVVGTACGCGLNTAVLQKGGNGRMGVLLNYSCGAHVCDPIDPAKPTIVLTHGWNPAPKAIRCTFGPASAAALKRRCGDSYNILSWDWNGVKVRPFNDEPLRIGRQQGRMLACALRARGVVPGRTQMIGHSLGTVVVSQAAACLDDLGCFCQITLLDPPTDFHEEIFERLCVQGRANCVENYWAPGISGYGGPASYAGVCNHNVGDGPHPICGIVNLGWSNHVCVMRWYYETIRCPGMRCGFQNSCLRKACGCGPPCCEGCQEACLAATDEGSDVRPDDQSNEPTAEVAARSAGSLSR